MEHLTPSGGTSAREQAVNGDGRPTPGEGTPTLVGTSIQGDTSNQKVFLKYEVCMLNDMPVAYMIIRYLFIYFLC